MRYDKASYQKMKDTPSMRQYAQMKKQYPDAILFFRMGDFYETFEDDARITSRVLDIALTSRDKGEDRTPMAGIPHHALMSYLPKMMQAGLKVALCEQMENPKDAKGIVRREVTKVITPGTVLDSEVLEARRSVSMMSIYTTKKSSIGLAIINLTEGKFEVFASTNTDKVAEIVLMINPAEIILPEAMIDMIHDEKLIKLNRVIEHIPTSFIPNFDFQDGEAFLKKHFHVANLKGFVREGLHESVLAGGALLKYIENAEKSEVKMIEKIEELSFSTTMYLDPSTVSNLEILSSAYAGKKSALVDIMDHSKTSMGARFIRYSLLYPLLNKSDIQERLDAVEILSKESIGNLQDILSQIADIERINARMSFLSASPRDFLALKASLHAYRSLIREVQNPDTYLTSLIGDPSLSTIADEIADHIESYISDDAGVALANGNIMKEGVNKELDELKKMLRSGNSWMKELQEKEIVRTEINSLKIRYNKVFGYYIEISNAHKSKIPSEYIRKQTLVNAERYITEELKEKEDMILHATDRIVAIENTLFASFKNDMLQYVQPLKKLAKHIALFDMLVSFAHTAVTRGYSKPVLSHDTIRKPIHIIAGRHPVLEQHVDEVYIPNDVYLDATDHQILLITGPNMSGKSSILRMCAIICLLAQVGSFVPAESAELAIVDRIFSRVGARDNIASGESTFMVEMNETANILNNATADSLIILDEIGRGTSTYDGVSIAYAVVEYIHEHIGAKTMFATHYHELTEMENRLKRVKNFNVLVKEEKERIVFLRVLQRGGTDKSYGIHVAKIAGVPNEVVKRAQFVLEQYDELKESMKKAEIPPLLSFLAQEVEEEPKDEKTLSLHEEKVLETLKDTDINLMTPLESMQLLESLQQILDD